MRRTPLQQSVQRIRSPCCGVQKDASASTQEAADILPELPPRLRQDVLWITQNSLVGTSRFLRVRASVALEPPWRLVLFAAWS